ncbi:NmrA family NAD(P)-binding protein [Streptomyces sp. NPDC021020]|uniref:NmrA family NAD(P)-binding protein n=1 Tax=Streptomyces sp. NPDC021020 TaxID=3365109 RepID=UPI0037A4389B
MPATTTVLVTGATGKQGGAVARRLLGAGYAVRAFVRDADRPAARALAALGADLAVGDFDAPASLAEALRGVHGVFAPQPGDLPDPDPGRNVRRGRALVDAAAAAGVAHLVYSSAAPVGRGSGVGHFEAMAEVEAHLGASGVPATVLRPVFFMENWSYLMPQARGGGRSGAVALAPGTALQMIAVADIARIAADCFAHPGEFTGRTLEIAGDELTVRQVAEAFTAADGAPARLARTPLDELRREAPYLVDFYAWLDGAGYQADVAALRGRWPDLLTFGAWLRTAS